MKKAIILLLLLKISAAHSQNTGAASGRILDKETSEAIVGATVSVKGTRISTSTDNQGRFLFTSLNNGKAVLVVSCVGYLTTELPFVVSGSDGSSLDVRLTADNRVGHEVVISASKRPEKITNAPASIHVIGAKELGQFAGSNVNELFTRVGGLEYNRSGVDEITVNARGFNSAFNNKVFQMVDGRNTMASASAGLALFNNGSTIKDDIDRIEILLGPQSALYGPNALNALFNYITKDPRKYEGTSISTSFGSQSQFSTRFRHALKINSKWAYKLTGEQVTWKEYPWYDSVRAGSKTGRFGPEASIPERRPERSLGRYRGEAHVYYSVSPKADIIVSGGGSKFTRYQVTTTTHNLLRDVTYGFLQARFVHPRFYFNIYNTWGNLGKTLSIGNYTRDFWNSTHDQNPGSRLSPDSAEIYATRLGNTLKEKSHRLNAETQYNYNFRKAGMLLVTGLTYQLDRPNGYGLTLIDSFQKISIAQYGAVIQLDKSLPWNFRLVATCRLDHHSDLGSFFAPRFALVKKLYQGNFRITWGRAYAMPSIQNQYAGINGLLFGNAAGAYYIPNGTNVNNTETHQTTTPLKPEQVSTWEIGYKGNITHKVFIDLSYYNGISKNFISPPRNVGGKVVTVNGFPIPHPAFPGDVVNDTLRGASFFTYFNYGDVRAYGIDAGLTFAFNKFVSLAVNYSWFGSDITSDDLKNDANNNHSVSPEERSLNAPKNRAVAILDIQNPLNTKLFLNLSARYVQQYEFYSGNQIGTVAGKGTWGSSTKNFDWGPLGHFITIDVQAGYRFSEMVSVNAAVTNLFNTRQIEMVASPSIGRLFMVELKVQVPYTKK
jgi:outer membrane receptor for ferrienterochelin and colicins